ncbi:Protein arginine N-methyltransferase 6, related [Eimeria necatrix]|uniref:Protein arginine N-methyltransferase 6, related n=1 Tax=Eimeria necatrix TaxID=51315 RepID=U6MMR4_9EIME|nr:Protein arginine N-methyltransferase 6, related [Eimeria necatrix]CDJ63744.1 Protein arginine N-methyltransferase 6, related [Eimeria necatrix]
MRSSVEDPMRSESTTAAAAAAASTAVAAAAAAGPGQEQQTLSPQKLDLKKCHEGSDQEILTDKEEDSDWDCSSSNSSNSSSNSDGTSSVSTLQDDESQEESPPALCLLCPFRCVGEDCSSGKGKKTPAAIVLQHMREVHGLDLTAVDKWLLPNEQRPHQQQLPPLNHYTRIALVTFLRQQQRRQEEQLQHQQDDQKGQPQEYTAVTEALRSLTADSPVFCCPEELLLAADSEDPLLWDVDDFSSDDEEAAASAGTCDLTAAAAAAPAGRKGSFFPPVTPCNTEVYDRVLQHRMGNAASAATAGANSKSSYSTEDATTALNGRRQNARVAVGDSAEDKGYFAGYGELSIHREMITDTARTEAYRDFLLQRAEAIRGKVVLDVGCGSGILSLFAAQAGARKVVALDASSPIVSVARRVVAANGFSSVIQVVHAKVESVELYWTDETETEVVALASGSAASAGLRLFACDVLVSEWMGYGLLFECMLFSVLHARDKYLKADGLLVPNKALIGVCTADMREEQQERRGPFESLVYGFDLSALQTPDDLLFGQLEVQLVQQQQLNQKQQQQQQPICLLDLNSVTAGEVRTLRCPINLSLPPPPEVCSSLVFYFDCFFEPIQPKGGPSLICFSKEVAAEGAATMDSPLAAETKPVAGTLVLSTSPLKQPTHWKQTVLHLLDGEGKAWSLSATPGYPTLRGHMSINPDPNPSSRRSIVITLELERQGKETLVRSYPMQ